MSTLSVRIYQSISDKNSSSPMEREFANETNLKFGNSKRSRKLVVGTICRELFAQMDFYKSVGSRLVNCSSPILIEFKSEGKIIDLGAEFGSTLTDKMKAGYTDKAKLTYAQRVLKFTNEALDRSERLAQSTDVNDLIAELEASVAAEEVAKLIAK